MNLVLTVALPALIRNLSSGQKLPIFIARLISLKDSLPFPPVTWRSPITGI